MYEDGWFADLDRVPADEVAPDLDGSEPVVLPDTIELQPPGPELGVMLAGVDRRALSGAQLVVLARARQPAYLQASLMADLVAIAERCDPRLSFPPNGADPIDHAEVEIAAARPGAAAPRPR